MASVQSSHERGGLMKPGVLFLLDLRSAHDSTILPIPASNSRRTLGASYSCISDDGVSLSVFIHSPNEVIESDANAGQRANETWSACN